MKRDPQKIKAFQREIWRYYDMYGREMPWRETRDPYAIFISEVMLQQTQVDRVRPKYEAWLKQFPDFAALAGASAADVIRAWQGLGYNRRALACKRAAEIVVAQHGGTLPNDRALLDALPGIGDATAGSLMAFAFNEPITFIETNIRRVYLHFFFPRSKDVSDDRIAKIVGITVDPRRPREWYYALMDYGTFLAKTTKNANVRSRHYSKQSRFEGSRRQVRGALLRELAKDEIMSIEKLTSLTGFEKSRVQEATYLLLTEGFIKKERKGYALARSD